jgi:hypothetical protein
MTLSVNLNTFGRNYILCFNFIVNVSLLILE